MADFISASDLDDVVQEYREKVKSAVVRANSRIHSDMEKIAKEATDNYYRGYTPKSYERTHQLYNSVGGYSEVVENGDSFSVPFGIDTDAPNYGAKKMRHKKSGRGRAKESLIFENFMEGEHPNTGVNSGSVEDEMSDMLDDYFDNEIEDIINEEIALID